ncbi:MAG: PIN domain-containing protein [Candidatus Micrarchaeota archaeon]|nr:PIN domain-containing protein [Candidatus Micrarchaeota archaeon]
MKDRMCFDTNVLVYAYDSAEPAKREICGNLVAKVFGGELAGVVTNQILAEFLYATTMKARIPFSSSEASEALDGYVKSMQWEKIDYAAETVAAAAKTSATHKVPFWDALIGETMRQSGVTTIITENERDFKRIPGIKVINPFKSGKI